jgi:hypothetical protein
MAVAMSLLMSDCFGINRTESQFSSWNTETPDVIFFEGI